MDSKNDVKETLKVDDFLVGLDDLRFECGVVSQAEFISVVNLYIALRFGAMPGRLPQNNQNPAK